MTQIIELPSLFEGCGPVPAERGAEGGVSAVGGPQNPPPTGAGGQDDVSLNKLARIRQGPNVRQSPVIRQSPIAGHSPISRQCSFYQTMPYWP